MQGKKVLPCPKSTQLRAMFCKKCTLFFKNARVIAKMAHAHQKNSSIDASVQKSVKGIEVI